MQEAKMFTSNVYTQNVSPCSFGSFSVLQLVPLQPFLFGCGLAESLHFEIKIMQHKFYKKTKRLAAFLIH